MAFKHNWGTQVWIVSANKIKDDDRKYTGRGEGGAGSGGGALLNSLEGHTENKTLVTGKLQPQNLLGLNGCRPSLTTLPYRR